MSHLTTNLIQVLAEKGSIEEFFRSELENAMNTLLQTELSAFLGYEKHDSTGWHTGNSRNGFYERTLSSTYGNLHLRIPRDRNGEFSSPLISKHQRRTDNLEATVIQLYSHGISTQEIADLIEVMYGSYYSKATISNITKATEEQVNLFHTRPIRGKYAFIYCDATYLTLRRDSCAKEALHVILGITTEGQKEVLDYAVYPTEAAANYREMLHNLKERGLEDVLLFISDGLVGLPDAVKEIYPKAKHQSCWVHLARNVGRVVRVTERKAILEELKSVYRADKKEEAEAALKVFLEKYEKYPKLAKLFAHNDSLFSFYAFPKSVRKSIYTSNLIENNNKGMKRYAKRKEQFPNEAALERFLCDQYSEYNRKNAERRHPGFKEAQEELEQIFDR